MSARISPGGQQFRGDDGTADPAVARALTAWRAAEGTERDAIAALHASRLLVPVVAIAGEVTRTGADKSSEMALPKLIGRDGRPAIIAFTSTDALARWRQDARPVPAEAPRVWQAAVAEQAAVVIDVAGPISFVLEGARLAALAAGQPLPLLHEDPDLSQAITTALATLPAITGFRLAPGNEARGTDLSVILTLAPVETRAAQIPPHPDSCRTNPGGERAANPGGERAAKPDGEPAANPDAERAAARISAALEGRVRAAEISVEPGTP